MKHIFIFLLIISIVGCTTSDKFSGSPEGNLTVETITGVVSTNTTYALAGQKIDFTATLPTTFRAIYNDTVSVEATTTNKVGSIRKASVIILPGQNSGTSSISVGGGIGNLYDSSFNLNLTGIKLGKELQGKHFLLNSNVLTINSGSTSVPDDNDKALTVKFSWLNLNKTNFIELNTTREKSVAVTFNRSSNSGKANIRYNSINYEAVFTNNLVDTCNKFVLDHAAAFNTLGIIVSASENSLIFNFANQNILPLTVVPIAPTATSLKGKVFGSSDYSPIGSGVKDFVILKSQKLRLDGQYSDEGAANSAFNPGTYIFKLGVTAASYLEVNPTPVLKYRIVVKYPNDSRVEIFNGVLNNLGPTPISAFTPVFKVVKTGSGDASQYVVTNLN